MHLSKDASKKQTNSQVVDEVVQRLTAVSPSLSHTLLLSRVCRRQGTGPRVTNWDSQQQATLLKQCLSRDSLTNLPSRTWWANCKATTLKKVWRKSIIFSWLTQQKRQSLATLIWTRPQRPKPSQWSRNLPPRKLVKSPQFFSKIIVPRHRNQRTNSSAKQ